ncbi:four-carbon acid sugar kinase family protein [Phyllobacterium sp. 628]|uniref:3-oxo-tetronate kinase n=1 Tax=Phyllobacterium sp. 628 TaxID=2718938 RepID=UPI00166230E4|nr:3-oxo-tetronate kinase [Phyllobacterium sp. 628]QND50784.1 four-carbon acid sugar kinase family protein [Phyllobacterium sp. 628]
MLLGAIADDFTGASDLANTLAKGGMATMQFVGTDHAAAPDCEAGIVALKTRSVPVDVAVHQSIGAARWLLDQGCQQIIFKYCSTFDSTPDGNIGPVAEALLDLLGADIAVVCPAFPATGRRLFMGHLFVGDRLLSESGMENHPLTPMTDSDIRRWLRRQTAAEVGHIPLDKVRAGPAVLNKAFAAENKAGRRLVVADAISDQDLQAIGKAAADHKLITGGSGIALGLPRNFRDKGLLSDNRKPLPVATGPGIVLSGSCSKASQNQVAYYLQGHPGLAIDPAALMSGAMTVKQALDWISRQADATPIVYSTANPDAVSSAQHNFGRQAVAEKIEHFFGDLARQLVGQGTRRIVVGGGETSGAVVEALDLHSLHIGREIDPGVPALIADRPEPLGLALKSGNFGSEDFFSKALLQVGTA